MMTKFRLIFILLAFAAFSCSKDDEVQPDQDLEDVEFSLAAEQTVVDVPQALATSDDQYAQMANTWAQSINGMSAYLGVFQIPGNAQKTSTPIVAGSGRVAKTEQDYLVYKYTWTYGQDQEWSVGYQIHAETDKYVFEIFFKMPDSSDWVRYIYAEQMKTGDQGNMKIYNAFDGSDTLLLTFEWEKAGDIFTGSWYSEPAGLSIDVQVNQSTKAGEVSYTSDGELQYEINWSGDGSGSWTYYVGGDVDSTGTWSV